MTQPVVAPEGTSHRGVIIAAVATVVAAIIVSAGTIIAASRNRESLEEKIGQLQKRLATTAQERDAANTRIAQLQEQLARRRNGPRTDEDGPPPVDPPARPMTVVGTVSFKGFDVALNGCIKDSGKVTCYLSVTNNEAEREITLLAQPGWDLSSRAIDDARRELRAQHAEFGSKEGNRPEVSIPSGTTLDGTLFFNVPATTKTFTVLQACFTYEYNEYKAEFRNVTLTAPQS